MKFKSKGYRVERKVKLLFQNAGWKVIRAGASLGEADLVCIKDGQCVLIQVKSTKKDVLYYYEYCNEFFEGFPFYLVVDFGYGKTVLTKPKKKVTASDGVRIKNFFEGINLST